MSFFMPVHRFVCRFLCRPKTGLYVVFYAVPKKKVIGLYVVFYAGLHVV